MKRPLLAKPSLATRSAIAAIFLTQILSACSIAQPQEKQAEIASTPSSTQTLAQSRLPAPTTKNNPQDAAFEVRSLALREKLANQDLDELDDWWRRRNISDPHKYLLPVILARLSLEEQYSRQHSWDILMSLEKEQSDLYHFRSIFDIRAFFLFRNQLPANVEATLDWYAVNMALRLSWGTAGGAESRGFDRTAALGIVG